jgi:exodeoxyribonuclease VII large subunit
MTHAEAEKQVFSVAELNQEIQRSLQQSFPGAIWVRGEVQRLAVDAARRKHNYFELHGTSGAGAAMAIPVAILDWDRKRYGLGRYLDGSDPDLQLAVCLQCVVDFYPPFGKLQLKMVGVDTGFTLGQLEARRRAVMAYLQKNNLLDLNASLTIPRVPLRIGLITSGGSAAEKDFLTVLQESGYGFQVRTADCRMMGEAMQGQIIAALQGMSRQDLDVIVITRGGGSRADLSWFDQQDLAEAVARTPMPVITAIGHEIDRSICDAVAHHACKTPTAAAQDLVARLQDAELIVDNSAQRLVNVVQHGLEAADRRLQTAGARLQPVVSGALRHWDQKLVNLGNRVLTMAQTGLRSRANRLEDSAHRLQRAAKAKMESAELKLSHQQQKLQLLDPARLLARGWSLTVDENGRVLRSIGGAAKGQTLVTRLIDGTISSTVDHVDEEGKR